MLFVLKYFVSLACQLDFGNLRKHILFTNRATLWCCMPKGILNSLRKLVDTPKGWLAFLNYCIMSTSKKIKKEAEKLFRTLSRKEITEELTAMVVIYISEMKSSPEDSSQTAFVGLRLTNFINNVSIILDKEVDDE